MSSHASNVIGSCSVTNERAFEYAIANEKRIRAMLLKSAYGDKNLADDMFSDVALERLPRLFELWDESKPIDNYMMCNLKWYAFKYVNHKKRKFEPLYDDHYKSGPGHLDVLDQLNEVDKYLIEASVFYGMSVQEIADELQWPVHVVRRVLKAAKQRVMDMYDDSRDAILMRRLLKCFTS
jgi:hypothetical protein